MDLKQRYAIYFEKAVGPSDSLVLERTSRMAVIHERLAENYDAHPELHEAARILEMTTEYPKGNRWIDENASQKALQLLKPWESRTRLQLLAELVRG